MDKEPANKAPANTDTDVETVPVETVPVEGVDFDVAWDTHPDNPYQWSRRRKWALVGAIASIGFLASVGTSIISPAHADLMAAFHVGSTVAMLPLTCYVAALGIGPVVLGGPLSETIGRRPILVAGPPLGLLFSVGAALTSSFPALCVLRFLAGFVLAPSLAIASGVLRETFQPAESGPPVALFILTPFLGPGFGPVIGAFATRKGWRWTQWTLVFFAAFSILLALFAVRETYHPVLRARLLRARTKNNHHHQHQHHSSASLWTHVHAFLTVSLLRPLHMLVAEPIVALSCLYVACEFATLFSFFAAVPYTFRVVYGFGREPCGLVFLSIVVGCLLGLVTVLACELVLYQPKAKQLQAAQAAHAQTDKQDNTLPPPPPPPHLPPEHRLYAAMLGSIGLPLGLFWFGWAAHRHAHWAAPTIAIVPFAWGNMCIFISLMQYMGDTYGGSVVASAASANSLARYSLAAVFPLFTLQMYERLGIAWASSLLGFIALALMPVPWLFFRYGPAIRGRSQYCE